MTDLRHESRGGKREGNDEDASFLYRQIKTRVSQAFQQQMDEESVEH